MKAISILQPWAALIVCGAKDVENRTWTTKHRGPLAICAGKRFSVDEHDTAGGTVGRLIAGTGEARRYWQAVTSDEFKTAEMRGGLVGVVDLVDVVRNSTSPWAIVGCFHWILANPRTVPFVAIKGRLGLFDVEVTS